MCGIAGFCDFNKNFLEDRERQEQIAFKMGQVLSHRGPDENDTYLSEHAAFAHRRLSVIDIERGRQPMKKTVGGYEFAIVYNGEIYNADKLREKLEQRGYHFFSKSDTEVVLAAYMSYGKRVVDMLEGIYSFAIWDSFDRSVFLCRDRFGVKPLFYANVGETFLFASEIKALFEYPGVKARVNRFGLCEIFGLGPARSPGCGVYEGIHEFPPGYMGYVDYSGVHIEQYYHLQAKEHRDNYEETVEHTRELLFSAIKRQLVSDVPLCTLLSGGLDSSLVSSVAAGELKKQGKKLSTYSFDFTDNQENFVASGFQPERDAPYVDLCVKYLDCDHTVLECNHEELFACLEEAVYARDLPGMADVDASMLYFARIIKKKHTVCLSGECADEVFGGYPWFRDREALLKPVFPWSKNLAVRKSVLSEEMIAKLPLEEYVRCQYKKTMSRVPVLERDGIDKKRKREMNYLNLAWFMTTLLDRKDRMTMASGLEVRVPFADHTLIEYLYNVPWEYKFHREQVKGLLKSVAEKKLPQEVIMRKKCPYPKTYDPKYEMLLKKELQRIVFEEKGPVADFLNVENMK
ncbi:MAG: asparagine synthase (glutamine-hydrolyzing), partial [Lachnospiraceae bacterium]|nr:asparagine synthase (glutamine-hydrolyzing) [Lachnospiraceae bacterium]